MKKCPNCGFDNQESDRFCKQCGALLEQKQYRRTGNGEEPVSNQNPKPSNHKPLIIILVIVIAVLLFALAFILGKNVMTHSNQNNTPKIEKTASSAKSAVSESATISESSSTATLWNNNKASQLADFMQTWGNKMDQQYEDCGINSGNDVNFYGYHFPSDFNTIEYKVDDQPVTVQWSQDGSGSADYNVVAIYSDANNSKAMDAHLYLFTIHNGQPVVLITQQTNGGDGLHFKETANQDLRNGFASIVNN